VLCYTQRNDVNKVTIELFVTTLSEREQFFIFCIYSKFMEK